MSPRRRKAPAGFRSRSGDDSSCSCLSDWSGSLPRGANRASSTRWPCGTLLVLVLWAWDLSRMAKPEQIEVRRVWSEPLGLAKRMSVTLELHNSSRGSISAKVSDEAPETFRRDLPNVEIVGARTGRAKRLVPDRASLARRRSIRRRLAALSEPPGPRGTMGASATCRKPCASIPISKKRRKCAST